MSTISDALKKVQRQRAGHTPERWRPEPLVSPPAAPSPVEERPSTKGVAPMVGVVLVVVALVIGLSIVMMRFGQSEAPQAKGGGQSVRPSAVPAPMKAVAGEQVVALTASNVPAGGVADASLPVAGTVSGAVVSVKPPTVPPHKLVGIFYSDHNPVALIDDLSLKEGEAVGRYCVVRILPESVVLKSDEGEVVLRLK